MKTINLCFIRLIIINLINFINYNKYKQTKTKKLITFLLISRLYILLCPIFFIINKQKRDLPDSNWNPSKWQLDTLPIKLRSLKI